MVDIADAADTGRPTRTSVGDTNAMAAVVGEIALLLSLTPSFPMDRHRVYSGTPKTRACADTMDT